MSEEQVRSLASPIRKELLAALMREGPLTVRELAAIVHATEQSVYYQLRLLLECGLARQVDVRGIGRKAEKVFDTVAERINLPERPESRQAVGKSILSMIRLLGRQFKAAHGAGMEGVMVAATTARLKPEDLRIVEAKMKEALDLAKERNDPEGTVVSLTAFVVPLADRNKG